MEIFHELGSTIERRWRDSNYDDRVFPRIAGEAIGSFDLLDKADPWDVVRWVQTTTELPRQADLASAFGNPPITVFMGARFYIDIYFWIDGTTAVHQHSFCGAFQVLLGGSIHSKFRFTTKREISPRLFVGKLQTINVELLERGDIRPILASSRYIHSLFHLERPSVTLVVRTGESPSGAPQLSYLKPHFAFDPFFTDALQTRRLGTARLLIDVAHPRADELIGELLSNSDFSTAFKVLELAFRSLANAPLEKAMGVETGVGRFEALLEIARRRHGELVDLIPDIFAEQKRQNNIFFRRTHVLEADHRFFLALLLNLDDRSRVLELVAKRFPKIDPVEKIMDWMEELTTTRMFGSHEANVLGIREYDDDYAFVLQGMFEGLSLEEIKSRFVAEFPEAVNDEAIEKLVSLFGSIRREPLFSAIFPVQTEEAKTFEKAPEVNHPA